MRRQRSKPEGPGRVGFADAADQVGWCICLAEPDARLGLRVEDELACLDQLRAALGLVVDGLVAHPIADRDGPRPLPKFVSFDPVGLLDLPAVEGQKLVRKSRVNRLTNLLVGAAEIVGLDVDDHDSSLVEPQLVSRRLASLSRETARVVDQEHIERAGFRIGDHSLELGALGCRRAADEVRVEGAVKAFFARVGARGVW